MIPMKQAEMALLTEIASKLLTDEFITATIQAVMRRVPSRAETTATRTTLEGRRRQVQMD